MQDRRVNITSAHCYPLCLLIILVSLVSIKSAARNVVWQELTVGIISPENIRLAPFASVHPVHAATIRSSLSSASLRQPKLRRNPRRRLQPHNEALVDVIQEHARPASDLGIEVHVNVAVANEFAGTLGHNEDAVVVCGEPGDALGVVVVDHVDAEAGGDEGDKAEEGDEEGGEVELHVDGW